MPGYSRCDLDPGQGAQVTLYSKTGGRQPRVARLDRLTAVFDGLLYEPGRLAQGLGVAGGPVHDPPLLLLHCYRAHGESFFASLRGTFAFLLWDADRGVLLGVRDPLGYYPCFFAQSGRNLLISTSACVLLGHPAVSRAVNRLALLDYFFDIWARREETFYASVKRVPPGHALRVRDNNLTLYRYWNPVPARKGCRLSKGDELGRFEELLARSVSRCVEHAPVGIFLSGGLDSVSVAVLARDSSLAAGLAPPFALSLVFPGPQYNEETVQKGAARQLGLPQELVPLETASGPSGLLGALRALNPEFAFPIQNYWMPAYNYLTVLAKRRGIRTILTGGGGDEWLGISPLLAADFIRTLHFGELCGLWISIARSFPVSKIHLGWNLTWTYGLRALLREETLRILGRFAPRALGAIVRARRAGKKPPWLKVEPQLRREFLQRIETSDSDFRPLDGPYGYYLGDALRGLDHPIVSWEMEEHFENACRLGVRLLHPYIDADLVEMLCAVSPELLAHGAASKGLVRESLARRLPDLGFQRQRKIVVRRALPQRVLGDGLRLWRESGKAKALPALGLAEADQLDIYLARLLKSESHCDTFRAWQIMGTEDWLRAHQ
jgi:asparagine synthetase B (glutamine-hydrolysing)